MLLSVNRPGLPDFSLSGHTKTGKINQMTTNYTKRSQIMPNDQKIFQMVVKYNGVFHFQGNFGLENKPSGNPGIDGFCRYPTYYPDSWLWCENYQFLNELGICRYYGG
jgi:hypothetical protein